MRFSARGDEQNSAFMEHIFRPSHLLAWLWLTSSTAETENKRKVLITKKGTMMLMIAHTIHTCTIAIHAETCGEYIYICDTERWKKNKTKSKGRKEEKEGRKKK